MMENKDSHMGYGEVALYMNPLGLISFVFLMSMSTSNCFYVIFIKLAYLTLWKNKT